MRILFLKISKLWGFQMVGPSLFHLMIADGKKVFLKKLINRRNTTIWVKFHFLLKTQLFIISKFLSLLFFQLFFNWGEEIPVLYYWLKIMANGLKIAGPPNFKMRMLILLLWSTLFKLRFWIILVISSWEKTEDKVLWVKYWCV